jgi:hypothetical protein
MILSQVIWCNKLFRFKDKCILFESWINSGIMFVKDIFNDKGHLMSANEIYNKLRKKHNWIAEYRTIVKIMKVYITKYNFDFNYCKYINVHLGKVPYLFDGKKQIDLGDNSGKKQQLFYHILVLKKFCRPYIEKMWQKEFVLCIDTLMWKKIYIRTCTTMTDKKLCEFRFKLLHNLLICNSKLCKWNDTVSNVCYYCNDIETTKHQLFDCAVKKMIWNQVSSMLNVDLKWKNLVLGFDEGNVIGITRNVICSIIMYCLYMHSYKMKENHNQELRCFLVSYLRYYFKVITNFETPIKIDETLYQKVTNCISMY